MIRYSLIVPSMDRVDEIVRLFQSLNCQTIRDFEVVLVDQNTDGRLDSIVEDFSKQLSINHIHADPCGAARARNIGIASALGEFLLWPDDDCWYPSTILQDFDRILSTNPTVAGIIGILVDEKGKPFNRWKPAKVKPVSLIDAFIHAGEPALMLRKEIVIRLGGFDDAIGTGADTLWGAGESTDLCIRVMKVGGHLLIDPSINIFHPNAGFPASDPSQRHKAYTYARGMGGILKKNNLGLHFLIIYLFTYVRAIVWNSLLFKWDEVGYHWSRLRGVLEGWVKYPGKAD
jgi:GT2 family glycosyltransferase